MRFRELAALAMPRGKSLGDVRGAEVLLRQQSVVDRTEQSEILGMRASSLRPGLFMMDLKKRPRRATTPSVAYVRALMSRRSMSENTIGNRRAMRAAVSRWKASLSLKRSCRTQ